MKGAFVIENLPIRFSRKKENKFSPGTGTTDIDLISFDPSNGGELSLNECKSNIHSTFLRESKERLLRQLEAQSGLADLLPFSAHVKTVKKRVFALRLAPAVRRAVPSDVEVIEGRDFENRVLDSLIDKIAEDPWIDPRDDVLGSLRILWHFGCLDRRYYVRQTRKILEKNPAITPGVLRDYLGLVSHKTAFAQQLLAEAKKPIMRVFGYGSLMWDNWQTEFECLSIQRGVLQAHQRAFNKASVRNWGSKQTPGPTLNVVSNPDATCEGLVFDFPAVKADGVMRYLEKREGGFHFPLLEIQLSSGEQAQAKVPVYSGNNLIVGKSSESIAKMIVAAQGTSGHCRDYVLGLASKLRDLKFTDPVVEEMVRLVETLR